MKITIATEYAIRAVTQMASTPERMFTAGELCELIDAPVKFLAKILQILAKKGILKSTKGVNGGFKIGGKIEKISLLDIVNAVDGPIMLNKCVVTGYKCDRKKTCAVHPVWMSAQSAVTKVLGEQNLKQLLQNFKANK